MEFELIIGTVAILFFFGLFIFFLLRVRGEVVRLWVANIVPYFPRMKLHRPLRIKIRRGILQTLNTEIINVINHALFTLKEDVETVREGVPEELADKWKEIRDNPAKHVIWTTFAKRRWRYKGQKGRWVFFYHFFPHDEMTLRFGRHKVWRVKLLATPIGFHAPTKNEWLKMRIQSLPKEQQKSLSKSVIQAFEKEYKREVKGRKWLLVMLHPTVTLTGEAQVIERLEGFQSLLPIIAHTMRTLGTKLAKFDALLASVKGFRGTQIEYRRMIEGLVDDLGRTVTQVQTLQRSLKEKRIPVVLSPTASPLPMMPSARPVEKPSRVKTVLGKEFPVSWFLFFVGFAGFFGGVLAYSLNPATWGVMVIGGFFLVIGSLMIWREKRSKLTMPVVEEAKERVKEATESVMEETA